MNIILYFLMNIIGVCGVVNELKRQKSDRLIFFIYTFLFLLIACLRVGAVKDLSDLAYYIDYFKNDIDSYFEPGYVFVTNCIKFLFGHNPYALIIVISSWVILFTYLASKICQKYMQDCSDTYLLSRNTSFYICLFFFVCPYWGGFFSWMTLRVGLATTLLYCASAYAINNKMLLSLLIAAVTILFHTSSVIFFLGMIPLIFVKEVKRRTYYIWFILILVSRFASYFTVSVGSIVESVVLSNDIFSHYINYLEPDVESSGLLSPQDIMYFLMGLLMLKGNLSDIKYNRAVLIYYLGLTAGAVFAGNGITMRLQWFFLSMVIFPLYYFVLDRRFAFKTKMNVALIYLLLQVGLAIRQFGWYI